MLVFFLQINLTDVVSLPISYLAAMNTPLPMIIIGYYLSELHMKDFIENKMQYLVIGLRLVLIPAALIAVLNLLHISGDIRTVCVIATCAPAAAMTTMFASKFDRDAELASRIVSISTLLSIITMPVIISFSQSI